MASANDIVTRAGRRSKILAGEEAFSAADASDYLQTLNDMMAGFGPRGIQYAHVTLTASATVNMPDEQIDNLIWMLTHRLAGETGMALSPDDMENIRQAKGALQAAYRVINPAVPDLALRRRRWGLNDFLRGD